MLTSKAVYAGVGPPWWLPANGLPGRDSIGASIDTSTAGDSWFLGACSLLAVAWHTIAGGGADSLWCDHHILALLCC